MVGLSVYNKMESIKLTEFSEAYHAFDLILQNIWNLRNIGKGTIVAVLEVKKRNTLKDLTITTHDVQHHIHIQGPLLP